MFQNQGGINPRMEAELIHGKGPKVMHMPKPICMTKNPKRVIERTTPLNKGKKRRRGPRNSKYQTLKVRKCNPESHVERKRPRGVEK